MKRVCLVSLLAWCLISCGFHLRGMRDLPPWLNTISIVSEHDHHGMEPILSHQFTQYGIRVLSDPTEASVWLIIEDDGFQQQVGSISSSTTPRQYQLYYTIRFRLQRANGKEIMPSNQVVVTRQVTLNSDRILGSTQEEDISKREMQRDAAIQIIDRLSRVHEY